MPTDDLNDWSTLGDLTVAARMKRTLERAGLTSIERLMRCGSPDELDKPALPSWRQRVRIEVAGDDDKPLTLYVKRYHHPPLSAQWSRFRAGAATHSTAWIEWDRIRQLTRDDVPCAAAVAFGESMNALWERQSVIVLQAAPGESLERWADRRSERCTADMIAALARFVRRFHGHGYVHRDLYLCHIFMDESATDGPLFRLIDLQRVIKPVWRTMRWRIKDLAALNYSTPARIATRGDRLRFLRTYLDVRRLAPDDKRLARLIAAKTRAIARHDERRRARHAAHKGYSR